MSNVVPLHPENAKQLTIELATILGAIPHDPPPDTALRLTKLLADAQRQSHQLRAILDDERIHHRTTADWATRLHTEREQLLAAIAQARAALRSNDPDKALQLLNTCIGDRSANG